MTNSEELDAAGGTGSSRAENSLFGEPEGSCREAPSDCWVMRQAGTLFPPWEAFE